LFNKFFKKQEEPKPKAQRVFPAFVDHPSTAKILSKENFMSKNVQEVFRSPSVTTGHSETIVWIENKTKYVVQIVFENKSSIFVESICSFEPVFGIDFFDGSLIQDIEEYHLAEKLNCTTSRLDVFGDSNRIGIEKYLKFRGFLT